jgi:hypothetical protein
VAANKNAAAEFPRAERVRQLAICWSEVKISLESI